MKPTTMQEAVTTEQHPPVPWRSTRPHRAPGTYVRVNGREAPVFNSPIHSLLLTGDATQVLKLWAEESVHTACPGTTEEYLFEEPYSRSSRAVDPSENPVRFGTVDRGDTVIYFRDRAPQYLSIRNPERLVLSGIMQSVGSIFDPIGDPMTKSIVGQYKTVVICQIDPWRGLKAVKFATLRSANSFGLQRLRDLVGNRSPTEVETTHHGRRETLPAAA